MSENWKLQLSLKLDGQHLLNIRAEMPEEFGSLLRSAVDDAPLIASVCRALEGAQTPQQAAPVRVVGGRLNVSQTGPQSAVPSGEVGPVQVESVSTSATKRDGTPMKSPRYMVKFGNGKMLSTFDQTLGQSAMTLNGQRVYYTTEAKGDFVNLSSIRSAV